MSLLGKRSVPAPIQHARRAARTLPLAASVAVLALTTAGVMAGSADAAAGPLAVSSFIKGSNASAVGDFNGDGINDTLFTNVRVDTGFGTTVTILFGSSAAPADVDVSQPLGTRVIRFATPSSAALPGGTLTAAAGVGDIDHDGYADILVDTDTVDYLVYGSASGAGTTVPVATAPNITQIKTKAGYGDNAGRIGDFNGDGYDDIGVQRGDIGLAIISGGPRVATLDANTQGARTSLINTPKTCGWVFFTYGCVYNGVASAPLGDVNGDGKADLAIANSQTGKGNSILLGRTGTFTMTVGTLSSQNIGLPSFPAAAGDTNGDGYADFILDKKTLIRGARTLPASYTGNENGVHLASASEEAFAASLGIKLQDDVYGVGDQNGDGNADLLMITNDRKARLITSVPAPGATLNLDAQPEIPGMPVNSISGGAVKVGDIDGDHAPDLLLTNVYPFDGQFVLTHAAGGPGGGGGQVGQAVLDAETDVVDGSGNLIPGVTVSTTWRCNGDPSQTVTSANGEVKVLGSYTGEGLCPSIVSTYTIPNPEAYSGCTWTQAYGVAKDLTDGVSADAQWSLSPGSPNNHYVHIATCVLPKAPTSLLDSGWLFNNPFITGSRVQLTQAKASQVGTMIWTKAAVDYNNKTISFNEEMSGGNGGGEGMTLAFLNPGPNGLPVGGAIGKGGAQLGFAGLSGIALAMDTNKEPGDPLGNFVGWTDGPNSSGGLNYLQTADPGIRLRNTVSIPIKVVSKNGVVSVYVNGSLRMSRTMTLPTPAYLAFTAATGSSTYQNHFVSNLTISTS